MAPNSKPPAPAEVQKEVTVKKEEGTNKPAPRNTIKPAKHSDTVQGVARERR